MLSFSIDIGSAVSTEIKSMNVVNVTSSCLFFFMLIFYFSFFPEQYDAFVKFTHDQLMRRFGEQPASCMYHPLIKHAYVFSL